MRILVTGGAGFIGSHTCDRLVAAGHDVVVLDALTAPVHPGGVPFHHTPGVELVVGDVRDRDLLTRLLRRVDAVVHLAAHQDHLPDFAAFADVNVTATALLYEIVVAERLDLARIVVASTQAVAGEGLHTCPVHGDQVPPMRSAQALRAGRWDLGCAVCGGPLALRPTPEDVADPHSAYGITKHAGETLALRLGRRHGIPTVALRYSTVQGERQSFHNAYSGACRLFCLHYRRGGAPTLFEDGASVRDVVDIHDVVDATVLVLAEERAVGRVFNVGGGTGFTVAAFAEIVRRHYGSDRPAVVTGEYRVGDTRHAVSDTDALKQLGWAPQRTPADSVAAYAGWLDELGAVPALSDAEVSRADERMRALGVVRRVRGGAG